MNSALVIKPMVCAWIERERERERERRRKGDPMGCTSPLFCWHQDSPLLGRYLTNFYEFDSPKSSMKPLRQDQLYIKKIWVPNPVMVAHLSCNKTQPWKGSSSPKLDPLVGIDDIWQWITLHQTEMNAMRDPHLAEYSQRCWNTKKYP